MPYTSELKGLIKKVEATRPARIEKKKRGEEFHLLTLKEREETTQESTTPISWKGEKGDSCGSKQRICHLPEIVALLEAKSRVNPDSIDLARIAYETDILILGGGGAGTAAALTAQEEGAKS